MALELMTPEIWSAQILKRLHNATVFFNVANTDYEGEISGFGDTVKIHEIGPISTNTYNSTSTSALTIETLSEAQKRLVVDQAKYAAFWIDDVNTKQIKPKVMSEGIREAAYAIANGIDAHIAGKYAEAALAIGGTSSTGVDVTSTNVLKYFSEAIKLFGENNVPNEGRWAVLPPWLVAKMILTRIVQDTANPEAIREARLYGGGGKGFKGRFMGFDIYESNNISALSSTDRYPCLFGYSGSISLAVQILTTETMRSVTVGFKTLFKTLGVYGAKVVRPNALGVLYADYTAEAS